MTAAQEVHEDNTQQQEREQIKIKAMSTLKFINITGKSEGAYLLGQMASALGRVEDLVVEHGEVEGETQTDRVGGSQVGEGNVLQRIKGPKFSVYLEVELCYG